MNPLTNVLTPRARQVLYAVLFVAAIVFAAFQAAEGDWSEFVGGLITALLGATAASNVQPADVSDPFDYPDSDLREAIESFHGGDGVSGNPSDMSSDDSEFGDGPTWGDHLKS
jgi:hypothetical protein